MTSSFTELRQRYRQQRRDLSDNAQRAASVKLAKAIQSSSYWQSSRHIAFYLPSDGEISCIPLIEEAWKTKKTCYLPMINVHTKTMVFVRYTPDAKLEANQYGILEPTDTSSMIAIQDLDLVLTPLVAFDEQGNRIGMGGGYYDRTFASKSEHTVMAGVAHKIQATTKINAQPWDIPLDVVFAV